MPPTSLFLSVLFVVAGCAPRSQLQLNLNPDVERPRKSVVIFLVDGMDLTRFNTMIAAGELPHIKEKFVDGGVRVKNAVTSLPSVTYANCTSVITGVFPGHHGIVGNYWFDRSSLTSHNYISYQSYRSVNEEFTAPTLYELLDDHFTINIQDHTPRGATRSIDNHEIFGWCWFFHQYLYVDRHVGMCFEDIADIANQVKRWPSVVMTYYPGVDEIGHRYGSDSPEYGEALRNIDAVVCHVTRALKVAGVEEFTYCVLVTDHSHVTTHTRRFDPVCWLREQRGLKVRTKPIEGRRDIDRLKALERYDVLGGLDADRVARFHLRGRQGWTHQPEPAEIEAWVKSDPSPSFSRPGAPGKGSAVPAIIDVPAVLFALVKSGPDRVHVLSKKGSTTVERHIAPGSPLRISPAADMPGNRIEYRVIAEQGDPLNYSADKKLSAFADAGWHTSREWLAATVGSDYPDFVPQAVEMFDSPHIGDVVLFAAADWSFYLEQEGGHGSCMRNDVMIPMYFAGPDLPHGATIGPGRIVDVMPTIVGLLGEQHRLEKLKLDGINLADELRHATKN